MKAGFLLEHNDQLRQLTYLIRAVRQQTRKVFYTQAAKHDLTEAWCLVLGVLHRQAPCALNQLATALHVSNSTASGIVERMCGAGLITKQRLPHNQRQIGISLTNAGKEAYENVERDYWEVLQPLRELPEGKLTQILKDQTMILETLEAINDDQ
ncbi:MarR family transcriptional regulator [Loigolactobacillus bifermentans DSM 20003]|uniref:MarR family transcriptional regulator n=1 Tax=Loigolactobacillus bifermentans DSM 20003 TaxID=1423726 RepID=A0A0R1GKF7_9LACO|nr:MarR family transcriptional regulator [Loigolactobacillus bifermentans DSM 20003]